MTAIAPAADDELCRDDGGAADGTDPDALQVGAEWWCEQNVQESEAEKTAGPSPERNASIFSLLVWHWLKPFIALGNKKTIQAQDIFDMNPNETTTHCEQIWKSALENCKALGESQSAMKLLWHCYGVEYCRLGLLNPIWFISAIFQVYILRALINVVTSGESAKWLRGALLVMSTFFTTSVGSLSLQMLNALTQKVGMKMRSTVSMVVFNKLLDMKLFSLARTNTGMMLNIITNDTQKLLDAATFAHFALFGPVEVITVSTLVIIEAGISAIPGVILVFMSQPIYVFMARIVGKLRIRALKYTDARVDLTGQILNGIRVIKYNGWTSPFLKHISKLRRDEMHRIKRASYLRASTSTIRDCLIPLASLVTFGTYTAMHKGQFMPPSQAFTILALFGVLVRPLSMGGIGVQAIAEAIIAIKRLQFLLDLKEVQDLNIQDDYEEVHAKNIDKAVMAVDACFSWHTSEMSQAVPQCLFEASKGDLKKNVTADNSSVKEEFFLKDINLVVNKGDFISVVGPVGSGKSSLLYSLLGEMQCIKGKYFVHHHVAYVPQQPWILNTTVRKNIVFTNPFDPERYKRIIWACALEPDIKEFPGGHETEIGDRGMNISGGQKARINLARACYSAAPIVFLDDPLAAVDVPTAKHLIKHVLNGLLKGRTVILVTHNKAVLNLCDHLFRMEDGHLFLVNKDDLLHDCTGSFMHMEDEKCNSNVVKDEGDIEQVKVNVSLDLGAKGRTTLQEERCEGAIQLSTWLAYVKTSGGLPIFSFVVVMFIFGQAVRIMVDYWLSVWTDQKYDLESRIYVAAYASFAIGATCTSLVRALIFTYATMVAATQMHDCMAEHVLRSPQLFFDQNVGGRILNRFSKDQSLVDDILPKKMQEFLERAVQGLGSLVFIGVLLPWFLLAIPPLMLTFLYVQHRYIVISRELKRLEAITRSPIYAHFSQTLQGIASVRACAAQSKFHATFISLIDTNHRAFILFVHMSRWLGVRLDFCANMCVVLTAALVVILKGSISPGLAGVVLVQSFQITEVIQLAVQWAAEVENYFTSVERIQAYCNVETEGDPFTKSGIISTGWPEQGQIEVINYTMAYRTDLPPVLNKISFKVNPREKIGIIGRTGAGKSSLVAALCRMVENAKCSGDIIIDGVNIKDVGLDDLRQRLSIVPQEPILFQGSVRFNLDPFEAYMDNDIYEVLSKVHLLNKVQSLEAGLDSSIAQNGENFSVGQRQLICLARSLLRRSRIIIMDEATAAIDGESDSLIQATIHTAFHDCTVLMIAHRLETIIDCDRVLVLAVGGYIMEFDTPCNLLAKQKNGKRSMFAEMVRQTGPITSVELYEAAHQLGLNQ